MTLGDKTSPGLLPSDKECTIGVCLYLQLVPMMIIDGRRCDHHVMGSHKATELPSPHFAQNATSSWLLLISAHVPTTSDFDDDD